VHHLERAQAPFRAQFVRKVIIMHKHVKLLDLHNLPVLPNQQAKDPLNGASANGVVPGGGESAARSFLANSKREVMREYPQFPGMHNLPPTPASPFPPHAASPFAQSSEY